MITLEIGANNIDLIERLKTFLFEYNVKGHIETKQGKLVFIVDEIIKK